MTDEADLIEQITNAWPEGGEQPSDHLAALLKRAVAQFPASSEVWVLYGDFLNRSDSDLNPDATVENMLLAYSRALELDPGCAEAHEELGYLHDVYRDDFEAAETSFRAAIAFGGGVDSYFGLARVLAELGRKNEALELLSPANCPFAAADLIQEIRIEIEEDLW